MQIYCIWRLRNVSLILKWMIWGTKCINIKSPIRWPPACGQRMYRHFVEKDLTKASSSVLWGDQLAAYKVQGRPFLLIRWDAHSGATTSIISILYFKEQCLFRSPTSVSFLPIAHCFKEKTKCASGLFLHSVPWILVISPSTLFVADGCDIGWKYSWTHKNRRKFEWEDALLVNVVCMGSWKAFFELETERAKHLLVKIFNL